MTGALTEFQHGMITAAFVMWTGFDEQHAFEILDTVGDIRERSLRDFQENHREMVEQWQRMKSLKDELWKKMRR